MPEAETAAFNETCTECGRSRQVGETWRLYFADRVAREAVIYCGLCAEIEFGPAARPHRSRSGSVTVDS